MNTVIFMSRLLLYNGRCFSLRFVWSCCAFCVLEQGLLKVLPLDVYRVWKGFRGSNRHFQPISELRLPSPRRTSFASEHSRDSDRFITVKADWGNPLLRVRFEYDWYDALRFETTGVRDRVPRWAQGQKEFILGTRYVHGYGEKLVSQSKSVIWMFRQGWLSVINQMSRAKQR